MANLKTFEQAFAEMYRWYVYKLGLQNLNIPGDIDKTLLEAVAFEIEQESYAYDQAIRAAIPEAMLYALGLDVLSARSARVTLTFARVTPATDECLIPAGTRVQSSAGAVFSTDSDAAVPRGGRSVTASATATTTGSSGNVEAGTLTLLNTLIPGIETVINIRPASGGTDGETGPALLTRVAEHFIDLARGTLPAITLAALRVVTVTGERATRALAVDGMTDPSIPASTGRVYLYRPEGVSATLRAQVLAVLEAQQRPIGTTLILDTVTPVVVPVSVQVTTNDVTVLTLIQQRLSTFFADINVGEQVRLDRLHAAVAVPDPRLYALHLTTPANDVQIGTYQKAELGAVTFTTQHYTPGTTWSDGISTTPLAATAVLPNGGYPLTVVNETDDGVQVEW